MTEIIVFSFAFPVGVFVYLVYSGLFSNPEFSNGEFETFLFACKRHSGDYGKIGVEMKALEKDLKSKKIDFKEGVGVFLDNPSMVAKEDLRSLAGVVLSAEQAQKASEAGIEVKEFPKSNGVVSEIPFKSAFSVMMGVMKVYPKFEIYKEENGLENFLSVEVYDKKRKKLLYFFPQENIQEINNLF